MSKDNENDLAENVIRGPWKKEVKQPDIDMITVQENIAFAEEMCQTVVVSMIHQLGENGVDIQEKSFIRDMGLVVELVKSAIYRDMGYKHPLQEFVKAFVDLTVEPDNTPHSEVRLEDIEHLTRGLKEDGDDPKIS